MAVIPIQEFWNIFHSNYSMQDKAQGLLFMVHSKNTSVRSILWHPLFSNTKFDLLIKSISSFLDSKVNRQGVTSHILSHAGRIRLYN